jgi:transposase InsO family protein
MEQRLEFVELASQPGANMSLLCERFEISRPVGYKWLKRYQEHGLEALNDKSRRPLTTPLRTDLEIEQQIVDLRKQYPEWGAKKLHKLLQGTLPSQHIPSRKTISRILKRNGLISEQRSQQARHYRRFCYENCNDLWQMDFKGYFPMLNNQLCHPLTILDDHSRFNIGLFACQNEKVTTVQQALIHVFKQYGLPEKILTDNGSPWGTTGQTIDAGLKLYSKLEVWLMLLQVKLIHGRPSHPQTQGKEERFHRTLKAELLQYEAFKNHTHCQQKFNQWRELYNCIRPHEALEMQAPASKYQPSPRSYPDILPKVEYQSSDIIKKVNGRSAINFKGKWFKVGKAFIGQPVAIRPTELDSQFEIFFCNQRIRVINFNSKV